MREHQSVGCALIHNQLAAGNQLRCFFCGLLHRSGRILVYVDNQNRYRYRYLEQLGTIVGVFNFFTLSV
jgi:hypothetical protein